MATMAEEFKEDFDNSVPGKQWYALEEFKFFHGWQDKQESTSDYEEDEHSEKVRITFKDKSSVIVEYWQYVENDAVLSAGNVVITK